MAIPRVKRRERIAIPSRTSFAFLMLASQQLDFTPHRARAELPRSPETTRLTRYRATRLRNVDFGTPRKAAHSAKVVDTPLASVSMSGTWPGRTGVRWRRCLFFQLHASMCEGSSAHPHSGHHRATETRLPVRSGAIRTLDDRHGELEWPAVPHPLNPYRVARSL